MNKIKLIIGSVVLILLIAAGLFITLNWNNLRGALPAISGPKTPAGTPLSSGQSSNPTNGSPATPANTIPGAPQVPANTTGIPLTLPAGFSASIYAKDLTDPRVMIWSPEGLMLVSLPGQGKVVALLDSQKTGVADQTVTVAENLNQPHGLATRCENDQCSLYVAENDKITLFDYDQVNHRATNGRKLVDLPAGGIHVTRTLMFLPAPDQDRLLVSIGSSCNVCRENDPERASVYSLNYDGSDFRLFSSGLRNTVFMSIHPVTGKIWATEMGRDFLGDDLPPDEINILQQDKNYGWPICYGKNIHDSDFDQNTYIRNPCMEPFEIPSYIDVPAHSAPLGLAFFPEEGWPEDYWYNLLVAYHGSWNRSVPDGYKIVRYKLDAQGNVLGSEDFISGWLPVNSDQAYGRPVDILIQPGGTIFVSDDKAGIIYKFKKETPSAP
jgi:glucose/arabinose dehydrogenase